jgi:hypothetical protein
MNGGVRHLKIFLNSSCEAAAEMAESGHFPSAHILAERTRRELLRFPRALIG